MYPLKDNDLDRLSREAADHYDVQPGTSGWEALEHRLNKELPPKEDKERRRFLFWLFLIVLLAGGGVLYTMTNANRPGTIQLTGANTMPVADKAKQQAANNTTITDQQAPSHNANGNTSPSGDAVHRGDVTTNTPAKTSDGNNSQQQHDRPAHQPATDQQIDKTSEQPTSGKKTGISIAPFSIGERPGKPAGARATNKQHVVVATPVALHAGTIARASSALPTATSVQDQSPEDHSLSSYKEPAPSLVQEPNSLVGQRGTIQAPALTLAVETKPAVAPLKRIREPRGWEISLLAGPDMSNVRFTDIDKFGYNVGLQLAYRFNNRWSVNTGLTYTRKNYTAQGKDFTKPVGNYWYNADVKKIAGDCVMFDIPLNVRYDLSIRPKTRWFVSAGASSYIMTDQNYTVDYLYNGIPRTYPHEEYTSSTYLFSIVNLSAGFETKLNKRLSLQAEPYFKLPTRGLGYGKLDLNSYGLYFSLRYQLHK